MKIWKGRYCSYKRVQGIEKAVRVSRTLTTKPSSLDDGPGIEYGIINNEVNVILNLRPVLWVGSQ